MPRKPNPPPDDPQQSERFLEIAREVGANTDEGAFKDALKKVALSKRKEEKTKT